MKRRYGRILDGSALAALFDGHPKLERLLIGAEEGAWNLILPTVCITDAQGILRADPSAWDVIWLTGNGVTVMPLDQHVALEIGPWPGPLGARHAAYEHNATRAVIVTCDPGQYRNLPVSLLVV